MTTHAVTQKDNHPKKIISMVILYTPYSLFALHNAIICAVFLRTIYK